MDLASATDRLYAGSPEDFTERRKALVAEARVARDRPLAVAISKLRRPTRSAWLVNLYARSHPDELAGLLDLGAALQTAQQRLVAADLRRLSAERQVAVAAATSRAVELGIAHGYTATEAVRREITDTLQAALADPDVAAQVRAATVTEAHAYGGFGPLGSPPIPGGESMPEATDLDDERARLRTAAKQRLEEAEAALSAAADRADQAAARADELASRVAALRVELAGAEEAESRARDVARVAREAVSEFVEAARSARLAYEAQ